MIVHFPDGVVVTGLVIVLAVDLVGWGKQISDASLILFSA